MPLLPLLFNLRLFARFNVLLSSLLLSNYFALLFNWRRRSSLGFVVWWKVNLRFFVGKRYSQKKVFAELHVVPGRQALQIRLEFRQAVIQSPFKRFFFIYIHSFCSTRLWGRWQSVVENYFHDRLAGRWDRRGRLGACGWKQGAVRTFQFSLKV